MAAISALLPASTLARIAYVRRCSSMSDSDSIVDSSSCGASNRSSSPSSGKRRRGASYARARVKQSDEQLQKLASQGDRLVDPNLLVFVYLFYQTCCLPLTSGQEYCKLDMIGSNARLGARHFHESSLQSCKPKAAQPRVCAALPSGKRGTK